MIFSYGSKELEYLKAKDKKLAAVIEKVGFIERKVDCDLFSSVVHHIIGQQISMKAQATIWGRMQDLLGTVNAQNMVAVDQDKLQSIGISSRKAQYLMDFALKVQRGEFKLEEILKLSDEEAIKQLSSLKGIGVWTAEMILLFCLQRLNIFSFDDLAIQRGLRMLYRHRYIDRERFEKYRRRFSPYCSVASLYLWAVSGGAMEGIDDPGLKLRAKKKLGAFKCNLNTIVL